MVDTDTQRFEPIRGRCQCGAIRFRVDARAHELYHCHCEMCRRSLGALFATFATVPRDALVIEQGAEQLATFDSSAQFHRHFCSRCGCHLIADDDRWPHLRWYAPATLDSSAHPGHRRSTEKHIFVASKVAWYEITGHLPCYAGFAPEDAG